MADYIEGKRAVEEALRAGVPIRRVLVSAETANQPEPRDVRGQRGRGTDKAAERGKGEGGRDHESSSRDAGSHGRGQRGARQSEGRRGRGDSIEPLLSKLRASGATVERVDRATLDRLSADGSSHGAHQGIMCEVPPYRYADINRIARTGAFKQASLVIVLDHVTDEGNLGAIARTAEVLGADGLIIPSKRSAQVSVGVYKTSAGAVMHLPIARVPNISAALQTMKDSGFWVAGASEKAKQDIWSSPLYGRVALVMGSEGEGISRLVLEGCDFLVALPQAGNIGSLNVAQATTAIGYEWMRQCRVRGLSAQAEASQAPNGASGPLSGTRSDG